MYAADISGSIAYAKALTLVGILTAEEEGKIIEGLQAVGKEWESGQVCCGGSFSPLFWPPLLSGIPNSSGLIPVRTCSR